MCLWPPRYGFTEALSFPPLGLFCYCGLMITSRRALNVGFIILSPKTRIKLSVSVPSPLWLYVPSPSQNQCYFSHLNPSCMNHEPLEGERDERREFPNLHRLHSLVRIISRCLCRLLWLHVISLRQNPCFSFLKSFCMDYEVRV